MSTLATLQALVVEGLGGRNNPGSVTVIQAALNYAATLAALVFNPSELEKQVGLVVVGGNSSVSTATLVRQLEIRSVWNATDAIKMWSVPYELWNTIVPVVVGSTKYFSEYGAMLYIRDAPVTNKTLTVSYGAYPSLLVNPTDVLEFEDHDSYIVSVALGICWVFLEEQGSAALAQKLAELATMPLIMGTSARNALRNQGNALQALLGTSGGA